MQPGSDWSDRSERVARLRAILRRREYKPDSRHEDAVARDQKCGLRWSAGESEIWDRAAQDRGVTTSELVRGVVNRAAEEVLAAAYASE
jgi:hypothetical protein